MKPSSVFNSSKSQPDFTSANKELQLDYTGPLSYGKRNSVYILVAIDRFSKYPTVMMTRTPGAQKIITFLSSYIDIHSTPQNFLELTKIPVLKK